MSFDGKPLAGRNRRSLDGLAFLDVVWMRREQPGSETGAIAGIV
jgi:hypothetical protein